MAERSKKEDINQIAVRVVQESTDTRPISVIVKNSAAVALGRLGGLKGGHARAAKLSKKRLKAIAKKAALARWNKEKSKS